MVQKLLENNICAACFLKCPSGKSTQPLPLHLVGLESLFADALPLPAQLPVATFPCIGRIIISHQPGFLVKCSAILRKIGRKYLTPLFQQPGPYQIVKLRISWKHGIFASFVKMSQCRHFRMSTFSEGVLHEILPTFHKQIA